jgi:hypothetical protein
MKQKEELRRSYLFKNNAHGRYKNYCKELADRMLLGDDNYPTSVSEAMEVMS